MIWQRAEQSREQSREQSKEQSRPHVIYLDWWRSAGRMESVERKEVTNTSVSSLPPQAARTSSLENKLISSNNARTSRIHWLDDCGKFHIQGNTNWGKWKVWPQMTVWSPGHLVLIRMVIVNMAASSVLWWRVWRGSVFLLTGVYQLPHPLDWLEGYWRSSRSPVWS